jgi:PAS domain S-box-containing protein
MNAAKSDSHAELEARLRFETLIADLSSRFVNLPADEVDREIMEAERRICEALDLDIAAIWQWSAGPPGCFTLTHYYSAQDGPQPAMRLSDTDFPWFRQLMIEGRIVPVSSLAMMPPEAALDRENARRLGIKSNLCLPLMVGGEPPVGLLGLNTTRMERDWPEALVNRLRIVAQVLANALARKRADEALRGARKSLSLAKEELEDRLRFESLISDLSARLVAASSNEVDQEIERSLDTLLRFFRCERCGLLEVIREEDAVRITHARYAEGVEEVSKALNLASLFPWAVPRIIDSGQPVCFSSVDELPSEAAVDRASWVGMGTKSSLNIPILSAGSVRHIIVIHSIQEERQWPESCIPRFRLLGEIIANADGRKRADQAVRESEDRLNLATEAAEAGLWVMDCQTQVFWATPRARAMFGYSPDEVIGMERFQSSVHPEDWPRVRGHLERAIHSGDPVDVEYRILPGEGRARWIVSRGRPYGQFADKSRHLVGLSMDITERKRAEEAFRTSETRLAAGADLAGLGHYEVDFGQPSCFVDGRLHDICGFPTGQHPGLQSLEFWMEHLHPDDRPRVLEERQKLHDGSLEQLSLEYRYLHPTAGQKWLHHLARVAARTEAGRTIRSFGVVRDITAQKRVELETLELRANLTHLTRVNALGALSGSLAHELNQPLGIILSNAQAAQELLAQEPPDVAEVQAILTDIVAADRRAGDVIERLRSLLKHGQISLQPLALNQVIEDVAQLAQADLIGRGVTVVRALAPGLPPIAGDRVQLQQLVLNLILNAADAMTANAPGTRRLHLQTRLHDGRVRASVRDEGTGLPADAERLFQPFYTTKTQGLGLGLSICRSIVAAHDGRLWAEPHPERGAVFHVELPAASGEGQVASGSSEQPKLPSPTAASHRPPSPHYLL